MSAVMESAGRGRPVIQTAIHLDGNQRLTRRRDVSCNRTPERRHEQRHRNCPGHGVTVQMLVLRLVGTRAHGRVALALVIEGARPARLTTRDKAANNSTSVRTRERVGAANGDPVWARFTNGKSCCRIIFHSPPNRKTQRDPRNGDLPQDGSSGMHEERGSSSAASPEEQKGQPVQAAPKNSTPLPLL